MGGMDGVVGEGVKMRGKGERRCTEMGSDAGGRVGVGQREKTQRE